MGRMGGVGERSGSREPVAGSRNAGAIGIPGSRF